MGPLNCCVEKFKISYSISTQLSTIQLSGDLSTVFAVWTVNNSRSGCQDSQLPKNLQTGA